jgi:hypothetical protein
MTEKRKLRPKKFIKTKSLKSYKSARERKHQTANRILKEIFDHKISWNNNKKKKLRPKNLITTKSLRVVSIIKKEEAPT